jgi:uncharacterized protein (TIGR02145 family)
VDGIVYGQPVQIDTQVWLNSDIEFYVSEEGEEISVLRGESVGENGTNVYQDSKSACPNGWNLPTLAEFEALLLVAGQTDQEIITFLTDPNGFNAVLTEEGDADYITLDIDLAADFAYTLQIRGGTEISTALVSTESDVYSTRCIARDPIFQIYPSPERVYYVGETILFQPPELTNVIAYQWLFQGLEVSLEPELSKVLENQGTFEVILNIVLFGDRPADAIYQYVFVAEAILKGNEEIIDDINYGKPMLIDGRVWMDTNAPLIDNSFDAASLSCPLGKILPTVYDLESLYRSSGNDFPEKLEYLINPEGFNLILAEDVTANIISSTIDPFSNEVYVLSVIQNDILIQTKPQEALPSNNFSVRCLQTNMLELDLNLHEQDYLADTEPVELKITYENAITATFYLDTGVIIEGLEASITYSSKQKDRHIVAVDIEIFGGLIVHNEQTFWVVASFGSTADTTLDLSLLQIKQIKPNAAGASNALVDYSTAPLCPRCDGGAWLLWREAETDMLGVLAMDAEGTIILDEDHALYQYGYPYDVAKSCSDGFIVLARSKEDTVYALAKEKFEGEVYFERTLVGEDPMMFYDKDGLPVDGMENMHHPVSGRIAYARDRFGAVFSYHNDFAAQTLLGDTFTSFDLEQVNDYIGYAFGSVNSLQQSLIFDGANYITASLSDTEPQNIRLSKIAYETLTDEIDPVHMRRNTLESFYVDIVEGGIEGMSELSTGRMSGIVQLAYGSYAIAYSRLPINDQPNEFGIIFFDEDLKVTNTAILGDADNINVIKMTKYGKNLLIIYSTQSEYLWDFYLSPWYN